MQPRGDGEDPRIERLTSENTRMKGVIAEIIDDYNDRRLHTELSHLRPVHYYRGKPESLLAKRRRKLQPARELRKQENIKLRQRLIPWKKDRSITNSKAAFVSL